MRSPRSPSLAIAALAASLVLPLPLHAQRIMPLGDSITVGRKQDGFDSYRKRLYEDLVASGAEVDFVGSQVAGSLDDPDHEGHNGRTADGMARYVRLWLLNAPPDIVLLHIGTNDLSLGDDPEAAALEVGDVLDRIDDFEALTGTRVAVVLARIINRRDTSCEGGRESTTAFNEALQTLADARIAAGDRLVVVDLESALSYPEDMLDCVHPNASGYRRMADAFRSALEPILDLPTARDRIGVALSGDLTGEGGLTAVSADDVMGIEPQASWNATVESAGSLDGLRDAFGFVRPSLHFEWSFESPGSSDNVPDAAPEPGNANHKLMQGLVISSFFPFARQPEPPATVSMSGLDGAFGDGAEYDVVLYMDAPESGRFLCDPHRQYVQLASTDAGTPALAGPVRVTLDADYSEPGADFDGATDDGHGNAYVYTSRGDGFEVALTRDASSHRCRNAYLNGVQVIGPAPTPQPCDNDVDDDGDGLVDFPDDPGCHGPYGLSEEADCADGIDNDGDGLVDHPADPGCRNELPSEREEPWSGCNDGVDNDLDAEIDWPADPQCADRWDPTERDPGCGLVGLEFAGLIAWAVGLRRAGGRAGAGARRAARRGGGRRARPRRRAFAGACRRCR